MKRIVSLSAVAALLALAACNNEPEVIDTNPDPMATQIANAAPVELPPPVTDSAIFRCRDNSIVYVDYMGDKTAANVRTAKDAPPVMVKAAAPGEPLTAEGFSVSGSGDSVEIAVNGGEAQTCNR